MSKSDKLNVAVIGLGMGSSHLNNYRNYERANPVAICDSNPVKLKEVAAKFGMAPEQCFSDYKTLLAQAKELDLHAVSVALPNVFHAPVTIECFEAGLHVLCEKPMAMNAQEARSMIEASKKAKRKLMINFSYRFTDQSQALKRLVDSGAVGDIYFGRTYWHRRRGVPGLGGWFSTKSMSGGGPIIDLGVHRLDLAMWLMGSPHPLTVSGCTYNPIGTRLAKEQGKTFDVEDLGAAMIRFNNGSTLLLEASWASNSEKIRDMATTLYGTKGGIVQRNIGETPEFEARVFSEQHGTLWEINLQQTMVPTPTPMAEFVDACLDDREPMATGQHGLDVQLILDAIYESASAGQEIQIAKLEKA